MKDKLIQIRADAEFLSKLEYLQKINGFKSVSETIRKIVEKEWRKEQNCGTWLPFEFGDYTWHKCSVCGTADQYIYPTPRGDGNVVDLTAVRNFCPKCGARMK